MSDVLKVFENEKFGQIRTTTINGEPWFVGKDIASALGYGTDSKSATNAVAKYVDDEDKGVTEMMTPGGKQKAIIINESGVYSLILRSKLPTAKEFKRWVTSEVLPSIRKNGGYIVGQNDMTPEELLSAALLMAQKTIESRDERIRIQAEQIKEMQPKVDYYDTILAAAGTMRITQISKCYGKSAQWLNKYLNEKHVQYRVNKQWVLYQKYTEKGYTKDVTDLVPFGDGYKAVVSTQWTQAGRKFIYDLLKADGIEPVCRGSLEE